LQRTIKEQKGILRGMPFFVEKSGKQEKRETGTQGNWETVLRPE